MSKPYTEYHAWDLPVRLFHWINVLCIFCLLMFGLIMLNKSSLGIQGNEARIGLKSIHVIIGYVFLANLAIRFIWAFTGSPRARWQGFWFLPSHIAAVRRDRELGKSGQAPAYIGHTPLARLSVSAIYLLLVVMAITGLIRAGTDIYYPPLGGIFAGYVAAEGVSPASIKPYDKSQVDETRYAELGAFKKPFGKIHVLGAYVLMGLILVHVGSCIYLEVRGEDGLISAMFSGRKLLDRVPSDPP